MSLDTAIQQSELSTVGKSIERADDIIQRFIEVSTNVFKESRTNKIADGMSIALTLANGIALIVVIISVVDYYLAYLVSWIPGFEKTPMMWLHDRLGNGLKHLILIIIGIK